METRMSCKNLLEPLRTQDQEFNPKNLIASKKVTFKFLHARKYILILHFQISIWYKININNTFSNIQKGAQYS